MAVQVSPEPGVNAVREGSFDSRYCDGSML